MHCPAPSRAFPLHTLLPQAVFAAAGKLAEHCATGWAFPWGLRTRMAELMLRGVFDSLEEGEYVEEQRELLGALQVCGLRLQVCRWLWFQVVAAPLWVGGGAKAEYVEEQKELLGALRAR